MVLAASPPPGQREAARNVAWMTLGVALIGLVVITCLTVLLLRRVRRRLTHGDRVRGTRHSDAWAEAGRRAGSPPAEAFEEPPPPSPGGEPHG